MALVSVLEALAFVSVFSEVANPLAPLYLRPVLQALGDDLQKVIRQRRVLAHSSLAQSLFTKV